MYARLLPAIAILLFVSPVFPQATTANVVGSVTDPSGGLIPSARTGGRLPALASQRLSTRIRKLQVAEISFIAVFRLQD